LKAPPIRLIRACAVWSGATPGIPWPERKTILTVGRFFAEGHNKRQDVVIEAFRRIAETGTTGVDLALAGAIHPSPEGRRRFNELQALAKGLDCAFFPNIARGDLAALYERSAVLIHATGFGVDGDEFPERLEHWGITPIEAASFGCIPVVYGRGGPREVVDVLGCDTAFLSVDQCAQIVSDLLQDPAGSTALSEHVRETCQAYSEESYATAIGDSLRELGVL
ncbi:MAG TPA: glycosyltransferase, partial [Acidimicrobiales bacterium]